MYEHTRDSFACAACVHACERTGRGGAGGEREVRCVRAGGRSLARALWLLGLCLCLARHLCVGHVMRTVGDDGLDHGLELGDTLGLALLGRGLGGQTGSCTESLVTSGCCGMSSTAEQPASSTSGTGPGGPAIVRVERNRACSLRNHQLITVKVRSTQAISSP